MRDPLEGVGPDGMIVTGADRSRLAPPFVPVLDAAGEAIAGTGASLYVYGSVATGRARVGRSDVDLLTIGLDRGTAGALAEALSARFADLTRAVEIAPATAADITGDSDEAYGGRVFLRHYCVSLAGSDAHRPDHDFPADRRAARGFNGDIAEHAARWRASVGGADPAALAVRIARKTLLAVAGLVSVADRTWTTDRATAAQRWAEIEPALAVGLDRFRRWAEEGAPTATAADVDGALDAVVEPVVARFHERIGRWAS